MKPAIKLELRIDWSEIDMLGHINNLAILKYVQSAKVNYLEKTLFTDARQMKKIIPIMAATSCQFVKQLYYPGKVCVHSFIEQIKTTSFILKHEIYNEKEEIVAYAEDVMVLFDFEQNSKIPIPEEMKLKLVDIEGK